MVTSLPLQPLVLPTPDPDYFGSLGFLLYTCPPGTFIPSVCPPPGTSTAVRTLTVPPRPGLCGTFAPLCLACRISDDFGECCCAPYLPGGLHSLRTGMRERYHIQVRANPGPRVLSTGDLRLGPQSKAPDLYRFLSLPLSRAPSGTTGLPSPFACPAPSVRWHGN